MPDQIQPYVDGWLGNERELTVIPIPQFPFRNNPTPDTYSRAYERQYQVQPKLFIPKIGNRTAWTNLLTYSEQLDNAAWTKTNLTVTADAGTAPDGQTTLDKLLETVTNGEHSVTQAATTAAAATEATIFAVGGLTRLWIRVAYVDSAATTFSAFFNIASGYVGTKSAGVTAKIVPLGNSQFRCVIQFTPAAGAGTFKVNVSTDGSTISYAGTITNGVYLWGAQVTTGTETPYISTVAVTRAISAPDRDKVDPMAYLVEESDPSLANSETAKSTREFARVPLQQIIPSSYLLSTPNYPLVQWVSGINILSLQTYAISGAYAAWMLSDDGNDLNSICGYYDVELTITSYTGDPATVIRVPGHNAIAGSVFVYRRTGKSNNIYKFVVASIAGNDLTGTTTLMEASGGIASGFVITRFISVDDNCRMQTRTTTDIGAALNVASRIIEDYYLPGVTSGISSATDIPNQNPFSLTDYLAAWAAKSTWFNISSAQLGPWKGPILKTSYTQAKLGAIP